MLAQTLATSFEITYLTGFMPYKFIGPDSNLYFEGRLLLTCSIFSFCMLIIFHCAFYLRLRGGDLYLFTKTSGKWLKIPKPES